MQPAEATLKGLPLDSLDLAGHVREGSLEGLRGEGTILMGSHLARRTGMMLNSVVNVISPQGELTPFGPRPKTTPMRVVAIFESGFYDLDNQFAFVSLENAQRLLLTGDVANSIELKVDALDRAPEIAMAAEKSVGSGLGATYWQEQNRQILGALRLEKTVSVITISLIQLVAALNILTALFMQVMDKRRDIAILLSMGAKRTQIARIFVMQGLMIGAAGIVLGLIFGYGLSYLADTHQWIPLDDEIYSLRAVPFDPKPWDAIWISLTALAVSFAATVYPARAATRVMPVEILRYE
jgi:lipoprotein-releasing system permease protein